MKAVEKLLELTQPETGGQPTPSEGTERLKEEVLTWAACEKAIRRFKKGKAVGSDLLDGYLLRIATEDIQRDYWRLLVEIVETEAYPREWNDWIAMLAMKPGEDPKELERRRDLWYTKCNGRWNNGQGYETGYGLSDRFPIEQGLGQGCLLSPARSKLMLAVMQRTVSKLCRGFDFTAAGESVPQLVYADDGLFLSNDIATMQLALECAWLVTKICGNSLQVKKKKKSAWSATYWENNEERDVEGYEMRMPDGMPIPQLKGDESYKYLGTELRTGWANGEGQTEMRERCVADCKRVIWIIGNLPHLTGEQIRRNMALALSGIIGYYGRSTGSSHGKTARASNK
ncbi:hypothetical protein EMIHUDRAFT_196329 [Emiliania huxleyi CCMP1516]|uniref:Reverse transcriptase domain-containing protein n=2 Tax=Emiliania huxleyi TaxID=2903 RepID=A0A0D3J3W6_EMIH1|nr:hypothetical protein EMIHUDRAFT_196329 [Emiliania huxleyi CCMP1516]EOD18201.1 hypothetical protein EMIHUDRAFT_196329 [Emiliania huxleyi CCMP1516]|eukprot:XP_005770630.1 hypothetical protein EMIHUDRAFT_196329 [Emiliania huxleyi CCMP1516]